MTFNEIKAQINKEKDLGFFSLLTRDTLFLYCQELVKEVDRLNKQIKIIEGRNVRN